MAIRWCCPGDLAQDRIYQIKSLRKLVIGAINGLKQVGVVDLLPIVARKQRASCRHGRRCCQSRGDRGRCDQGHCLHYCRLDLVFFQNHGHEATGAGCPGDLANGEREAFCYSTGSGDDDHLVRQESCTHNPYVARHYRRKLVGSLPLGIPTVVVSQQTGVHATNSMVMQDTDMDFI